MSDRTNGNGRAFFPGRSDINARTTKFRVLGGIGEEFFEGKCTYIARSLLGMLLLHKSGRSAVGGIIIETEAYLGENDPACHLSKGRTKRTIPFYRGKGTVYVFRIFRYDNLNFITEYGSYPECVLIRALEPTHGLRYMKKRRGTSLPTNLTSGPGKLTQALGISKERSNNKHIRDSGLILFKTDLDAPIEVSRRIGISRATEWPLRFFLSGSPFVSVATAGSVNNDSLDLDDYYESLNIRGGLSP